MEMGKTFFEVERLVAVILDVEKNNGLVLNTRSHSREIIKKNPRLAFYQK